MTANPIPYLIQGNNITLYIPGKATVINDSHLNYEKIKQAIKDKDWVSIPTLVDVKKTIEVQSAGSIKFDGSVVTMNGTVLHGALSNRILDLFKSGFDVKPLLNFYNRLMLNPSKRAVDELYNFLERCNLPITETGHFLAYKRVRADYMDCHTGKISNAVGRVVEMLRNQVDDNCKNHCSHGLHFCSYDYLKSFSGDRVVVLEIDPADVVSIPDDYSFTKGRTWRYRVVDEIPLETTVKQDVLTQSNTKFSGILRAETPKNRVTGSIEDFIEDMSWHDFESFFEEMTGEVPIYNYMMNRIDALGFMLKDHTYSELREHLETRTQKMR